MNDLDKTIKHFESLQKRYTTQHKGQMCERVSDALEALYRLKRQKNYSGIVKDQQNDAPFIKKYCLNCGSQRCEGVGTEWFKGCV